MRIDTSTTGGRLKKARLSAGYTAVDDVIVEMRKRLPKELCVSRGSLYRWEADLFPPDPFICSILSGIYEVDLVDIDPDVAAAYWELITHTRPGPKYRASDLRERERRCFPASPDSVTKAA